MTREPWQITREMFLSLDEVDALLQHVRRKEADAKPTDKPAALTDRLVIEILLFSGLRNSELCRLALRDAPVSPGDAALHVRGTPREDRTVYIPHELSDLIRRYVSEVRGLKRLDHRSQTDLEHPLLINERGRAYERTGLYRRVVRILTESGLAERASVQLLRHTYGYLAYARTGGNLLFVQRQLGHAHPMVTSIYAQFVDESYPALANCIAGDQGAPSPQPAAKPRAKAGTTRRKE